MAMPPPPVPTAPPTSPRTAARSEAKASQQSLIPSLQHSALCGNTEAAFQLAQVRQVAALSRNHTRTRTLTLDPCDLSLERGQLVEAGRIQQALIGMTSQQPSRENAHILQGVCQAQKPRYCDYAALAYTWYAVAAHGTGVSTRHHPPSPASSSPTLRFWLSAAGKRRCVSPWQHALCRAGDGAQRGSCSGLVHTSRLPCRWMSRRCSKRGWCRPRRWLPRATAYLEGRDSHCRGRW